MNQIEKLYLNLRIKKAKRSDLSESVCEDSCLDISCDKCRYLLFPPFIPAKQTELLKIILKRGTVHIYDKGNNEYVYSCGNIVGPKEVGIYQAFAGLVNQLFNEFTNEEKVYMREVITRVYK